MRAFWRPLWRLWLALTPPADAERLAWELARFPPPECTAAARKFGDVHWEWTKRRLYSPTQDDPAEYHAWEQDALARAWAWQYLEWAHQAHARRDWQTCRRWLGRLRESLPPGWYWQGRMPAVAPLGRFQVIH